MLRVAQVTDIHLFAAAEGELLGLPTQQSFQAVLAELQQLDPRPDLLLLTGDLSQDETPDSYRRLYDLLAPLRIPVYWLGGNHDRLPVVDRILCQPPFYGDKALQRNGWQFLLLGSGVPGKVHGSLDSQSLDWLDRQLSQNRDRPTLIALHHPPFPVNSEWIDGSRLQNPDDLFAIIDRHPQVRLVVFGHIHQECDRLRRGVQYFGTPSTCVQFKPGSRKFALDDKSPGFRLLDLRSDGRWTTRVQRVRQVLQPNLAATGY